MCCMLLAWQKQVGWVVDLVLGVILYHLYNADTTEAALMYCARLRNVVCAVRVTLQAARKPPYTQLADTGYLPWANDVVMAAAKSATSAQQ